MKLATLRNGRPDGQLFVVSSDNTRCVSAGRIAPSLQAALDDWDTALPQLENLSQSLNNHEIAGQAFEQSAALAPLPRAYQWIDGAGYLGHMERVRTLSGSSETAVSGDQPSLHQGASDCLGAPTDPIIVPKADLAIDFEAEIAVITGPVPMGANSAEAARAIRLVTLCNDVALRRLVASDLREGFGFFHSKPVTAFAPIVATPDELGDMWSGNRLNARVDVTVNDQPYGRLQAGVGMNFDFAQIIAAACTTRRLGCGTIIGSGAIANAHDNVLPMGRDDLGFGCIAEARTLEKSKSGTAKTPYLQPGDEVSMIAYDNNNTSIFGTIRQKVELVAG